MCLAFSLSIQQGIAQQTIVMYHESPIHGTVLWDRTTSDRVFFTHEQGLSDTLIQFVPRREVEYIECDSSRYVYKGARKGWQLWDGTAFSATPQHGMLYGVSGGIVSKGWSVEGSAMHYLSRSNFFGIGGYFRYANTAPFKHVNEHWGYNYTNQAFSLGVQFEFRGYLRKLKSFYYIQVGGGCTYHRFVDCKPEYLAQFAVMAAAFMKAVSGVESVDYASLAGVLVLVAAVSLFGWKTCLGGRPFRKIMKMKTKNR